MAVKFWSGERMNTLLYGNRAPRNLAEDRFVPWFWENERVYEYFDRFTRELIAAGKKRYSGYSVAHRIRWEVNIAITGATGEEEFKLSNSMIPYLARVWQDRNPEYGNFFGLKKIKHAPAPKQHAWDYISTHVLPPMPVAA
jgi:hypothetical protein